MIAPETATATARCEARTGYTPGRFGFEQTRCDQERGLRSFVNAEGETHWFCPASGHAEMVAIRYGGIAALTRPASPDCESGGYPGCTCSVCFD